MEHKQVVLLISTRRPPIQTQNRLGQKHPILPRAAIVFLSPDASRNKRPWQGQDRSMV